MKRDDFNELLLSELRDLKNEVKEVRQTDIPGLRTEVAGFHEKIETLKRQQAWSTRLYTILGGAIAVAITKFTGHP